MCCSSKAGGAQAQFALQRSSWPNSARQLEQIQQLQQQLQQQLEEQKQRQKPLFPMACEAPGRGPPAVPELAQNGQYWPPLTHAAFIAVPEGSGQPQSPCRIAVSPARRTCRCRRRSWVGGRPQWWPQEAAPTSRLVGRV